MKCPQCSTVDLVMSERQGIEIDYCPQCRGVWLDRGELDKIVERSNAHLAAAPPPPPPAYGRRDDDDDDDDDRHGRRQYPPGSAPAPRRKSFWSELFD